MRTALVPIAASGAQSAALAGELADFLIAVEPDAELGEHFDAAGGCGKPRVGQVPISWDPSRDTAIERAHDQFRWFGSGWKVNSELPSTAAFAGATQFVAPEDAKNLPTSPQNLTVSLTLDNGFWADNGEEIRKRFTTWLAQ